ncbi:MAG: hypothetical protein V8R46_10030 [Eubacterium ramulus]
MTQMEMSMVATVSCLYANTAILKDGKTLVKASDRKTGITTLTVDGKNATYDHYVIKGIKICSGKSKNKKSGSVQKSLQCSRKW